MTFYNFIPLLILVFLIIFYADITRFTAGFLIVLFLVVLLFYVIIEKNV